MFANLIQKLVLTNSFVSDNLLASLKISGDAMNVNELLNDINGMIGENDRILLEDVLSAYRDNPSARPLLKIILQRKMLNVSVDATGSTPIAYVYPKTGDDA